MKRLSVTALLFLVVSTNGIGQTKNAVLVSGPMLGHTDTRSALLWMQFAEGVTSANVSYRKKQGVSATKLVTNRLEGSEFNTTVFTLGGLEPGTRYVYYVRAGNEKRILDSGELSTQQLWQLRTPPPDFTILSGSCAYFNEPPYDRPGTPYGQNDSAIFYHMGREKADLMIWLGDNWYTREVDYHSTWGLYYRASRDRQMKVMAPLLRNMPQYAIWDDHDYGPNDADKSFHLKESARNVFKSYWANPSYGHNQQGIYTRFSFNDVDFFLLDDRWWRSNDRMKDSVDGKPNPEKEMFGKEQMDWLKNSLLHSNTKGSTSFRVIVTGSQILNQASRWDAFRRFPTEYNELMDFLQANKIKGVIFMTGDRHHSEVIRLDRAGNYPLYDITVSPLTSGAAKTTGAEANNPGRISKEIVEQNYGRLRVSGEPKNRRLTVEFVGINGKVIDTWSVYQTELTAD